MEVRGKYHVFGTLRRDVGAHSQADVGGGEGEGEGGEEESKDWG